MEIWKQPIGIEVIQPFNVVIPTTRVENFIAPNTNFVKGGILIGFTTNLGHGSSRVLTRRNLNGSLGLPTTTIRVIGAP